MELKSRDIRHTVLLFLIVAIVPLLFFPSDLGLRFSMPIVVFMLLELVYYGAVITAFLGWQSARRVTVPVFITLGFRYSAGLVFAVLLFLMNGTPIGDAFSAGLWSYKPAVLLHSLTAPLILMSIFRIAFGAKDSLRVSKLTVTPFRRDENAPGVAEEMAAGAGDRTTSRTNAGSGAVIGLGQRTAELRDPAPSGFDVAMRHVFELSAVKFAILIDREGLPVAFAGDDSVLRDVWSPIGRLLSEQIQSSLLRVANVVLEGFDLSLDAFRVHSVSVCGMWLLVGADRKSEELEKVRINQAVAMIKRTYEEKYSQTGLRKSPEESYV
jgi:hypothetical protein